MELRDCKSHGLMNPVLASDLQFAKKKCAFVLEKPLWDILEYITLFAKLEPCVIFMIFFQFCSFYSSFLEISNLPLHVYLKTY